MDGPRHALNYGHPLALSAARRNRHATPDSSQILAALLLFLYPSDVEASARWYVDDIIAPPIEVARDGFIYLPEGPGTGYRVDFEQVARYQIRREEFRL
jgi:L-alanine-DL-glutamate epimerase-like enolase superfamily enzyme